MHAPDTGDPTCRIIGLATRMHRRLGPGLLGGDHDLGEAAI